MTNVIRSAVFALFLLADSAHPLAAEPEPRPPSTVVATVDGVPITAGEWQRELDRAVQDRELAPAALQPARDAALKQLIDRRLVVAYMKQNGFAARPQEVDRQLQRIRTRLEQQALTLDQYLQRTGLDSVELRQNVEWQIGWPRFLERYLTDENRERYFQQHRREFDGTEVSVAHILFRVESPDDPPSRDAAVAAAEQLRQRLVAGELTFAQAARQHSAAPTAGDGGRIGFIGRRQPMPEAFSQAAFALEPGAISPAVVTAFGVHLIQCLEIKPGNQRWQDVRNDLEPALTQYLFRWAANRQRPLAKIEIKDAVPKRK
ncbi:MAG: peptidylprolyl isomerase [Pirellulaceae bacterium]|nr:peptidylprolyl isomerase [Pirellulaceae bacterium]